LAGNICNSSAFVFAQMKVSYPCIPALAILVVLLLLYLNCQGYATSKLTPSQVRMSFSNETENNLEIRKIIPFNNTRLSSLSIDSISNRVYVSGAPDHSSTNPSTHCLQQDTTESSIFLSSNFSCSLIYILDGNTGQLNNIFRLRYGEHIHDIDLDPHSGKVYAAGEYNYLENVTTVNEELIQYEDDVIYVINGTKVTSPDTITANDIQRIRLYGELEEGKEGDMSSIALDSNTNMVYASIRYFQGGREGVFIVDIDNNTTTCEIHSNDITPTTKLNATNAPATNVIKFIPLGDTGPDQILVNNNTKAIYTSLENDDFVGLIDVINNTVQEKIILQEPRAMSINPSSGLLYVASGTSHWFNVIDMNTSKVISANTQIAYPVASVANKITGKVYVADCLLCDDSDFTNGTSIYELDSNGSTINWEAYYNINIKENGLAINPSTNKLYAIGTDLQSGMPNLYVINTSLQ
jgi:hypothetical protein